MNEMNSNNNTNENSNSTNENGKNNDNKKIEKALKTLQDLRCASSLVFLGSIIFLIWFGVQISVIATDLIGTLIVIAATLLLLSFDFRMFSWALDMTEEGIDELRLKLGMEPLYSDYDE